MPSIIEQDAAKFKVLSDRRKATSREDEDTHQCVAGEGLGEEGEIRQLEAEGR